MPDFVSKGAAPQRKRDGIYVPGLYEAWIRRHCAAHVRSEARPDPRFTDPDEPFDDAQREARMAQARRSAESAAAQRIAEGKPIIATLLRPRHRMHLWWEPQGSGLVIPACFDANCLYDIHADDYVTLNVAATHWYLGNRAAEEARRKTAVAQLNPAPAVGHNGRKHNGAVVA